jgi:hypothetical protein
VLQVLSNGKVLAQIPMPDGTRDEPGKALNVFGRLPIDQMAPGTYELQMVIKQGATQLSRNTVLRIID